MTNLNDLPENGKITPDFIQMAHFQHLSDVLCGVVVTIDQMMIKGALKDDEYNQMAMLRMALRQCTAHLHDFQPALDEDQQQQLREWIDKGLILPDIGKRLSRSEAAL